MAVTEYTPMTSLQNPVGYETAAAAATAPLRALVGGPSRVALAGCRAGFSRSQADTGAAYAAIKRAIDVTVAGVLLLALLPVLLLVAAAIWVEDRGPVLFWQYRVGRNGKAFRFLKFRSMVRGAETLRERLLAHNEATGPIFKMRRDPRVTRVGRWIRRYSLDELPQLLHVLRGEMSLVGPRPLPVAEVARGTEQERRRHSVPPGLICFREVGGRSHLTFERWMELDLLYVETRSLRTDLGILRRALPAVLRGEGAY